MAAQHWRCSRCCAHSRQKGWARATAGRRRDKGGLPVPVALDDNAALAVGAVLVSGYALDLGAGQGAVSRTSTVFWAAQGQFQAVDAPVGAHQAPELIHLGRLGALPAACAVLGQELQRVGARDVDGRPACPEQASCTASLARLLLQLSGSGLLASSAGLPVSAAGWLVLLDDLEASDRR